MLKLKSQFMVFLLGSIMLCSGCSEPDKEKHESVVSETKEKEDLFFTTPRGAAFDLYNKNPNYFGSPFAIEVLDVKEKGNTTFIFTMKGHFEYEMPIDADYDIGMRAYVIDIEVNQQDDNRWLANPISAELDDEKIEDY